ncbi:MAG: 6-phosphofructokinase [Trichodesmium sp. St11_bin5]|nr:6-phosphofructokinase [Trichodesmium sp. St11_bin5]MDT9342190.1 6-phosphofructokinase [Trichodesmium erythraeum 21-75]
MLEVMWGDAIHIPLNAGFASSTDMILIPEIPDKIDNICNYISKRSNLDKNYSLIVLAEAVRTESDTR